jgi:nitrite reductase (NADH) large subunit
MKRVAVIGNSIAGVKAIEELQSLDSSVQPIFILTEKGLPYNREQLADLLAQKIGIKEFFYKQRDYFEKNNIQLIENKKVNRINFKRGRISFEDKETIDYDALIITDMEGNKFPSIKGTNKEGLYNGGRFEDIKKVLDGLVFIDTCAIRAVSLDALKMALALHQREKEVIVIVPPGTFADVPDQEFPQMLLQNLEDRGLRMIADQDIAEILGDSQLKAVRLSSGKVFGCQAVFLNGLDPELKTFKETPLQFNETITVDEQFRTNIENVWAVDRVIDSKSKLTQIFGGFNFVQLIEHGQRVALGICGQSPVEISGIADCPKEIFSDKDAFKISVEAYLGIPLNPLTVSKTLQ